MLANINADDTVIISAKVNARNIKSSDLEKSYNSFEFVRSTHHTIFINKSAHTTIVATKYDIKDFLLF